MSVIQAIVLGIIQGLTEFLPISSSGHLAIAGHLFGRLLPEGDAPLAFDVLLHFASVVAIVAVLRRDIWSLFTTKRRLILPLAVGTIPAGIAGLLLEGYFESAKHAMAAVGAALMFTGFVLALCERMGRRSQELASVGLADALIIGCAQAVALAPGVSRSGMTIGGGLLRGLTRRACVRFSFLLAIPAILGASVVKMQEMAEIADNGGALPLAAGVAASLAASILAIKALLRLVRRRSLAVFAYYCVPLGAVVFVLAAPGKFAAWLAALGLPGTAAGAGGYALAILIAAASAAVVFFGLLRKKRPSADQPPKEAIEDTTDE